MIHLSLFIFLVAALALCFACNRDIFSPAKFYHMSLTVYFLSIFWVEQKGCVYAIYLGFILVGMIMSIVEACAQSKHGVVLTRPEPSAMLPSRFVIVLWALSAIPVLAQCYLIHITGGMASLVRVIAHRVVEWQGLGPLIMVIKLMAPINLVYFALGFAYRKRHNAIWWLLYDLHLALFGIIALLQGSRGFILLHFVSMGVIYHYLRRPVKLRYALVAGGVLLGIAGFLGTVRNNLTRLETIESLADMQGDTLNLKMFSYGTNPLNVVFSRDFEDTQYGKTFLAAITNFVPRKLWADKFDNGRVVLTRFAQGHDYAGTSNMSTGIVVENIINFGYPLGILCAFIALVGVIPAVIMFYVYSLRCINRSIGLRRVCSVILYAYATGIAGNLLFGEFTGLVGGLVIKVVLLLMVILFLRLRVFSRHRMIADEVLYAVYVV